MSTYQREQQSCFNERLPSLGKKYMKPYNTIVNFFACTRLGNAGKVQRTYALFSCEGNLRVDTDLC